MLAIPDLQDKNVRALVAAIAPRAKPQYVVHSPLAGKPLKECFPIVAAHVASNGGKSVFGWSIIQLTGIWLEAEFHAVWQDPSCSLTDLTPREFRVESILFLHDPRRVYSGVQVQSHFLPLTTHPAVIRHIQLAKQLFIETNRGDLAYAKSYPETPTITSIKAELEYTLQNFPWPK